MSVEDVQDSAKKEEIDDNARVEKLDEDIAPGEEVMTEGGYGWVCVVGVFLVTAHSWGINTAYSVFLASYLGGTDINGASAVNFGWLGGLLWGIPMAACPLAVIIVRHWGSRPCLIMGSLLECGSLIGASYANSVWQLYLAQGIGFSMGVGFFLLATQNVIPQWFVKRRSFAAGLAVSGTGVGSITYSLASGRLIDEMGTAKALRILAIICGCVTMVCAFLIKDRDAQIEPRYALVDFKMLRRPQFLMLAAFSVLNMLGEIILLNQLVSYGETNAGLTSHEGSVIGAMVGLGQVLGRIGVGWCSDRLGRINMAVLATFGSGVLTLIVWPLSHTYGVLIFYSITVGACVGSFWAFVAPIIAEVIGLRDLPTGLSMIFLLIVPACIVSPVIGLELSSNYDPSYLSTQMFSGFMYIGSALFGWLLRCWKLEANRAFPNHDDSNHFGGLDAVSEIPGWSPFTKSFAKTLFTWEII